MVNRTRRWTERKERKETSEFRQQVRAERKEKAEERKLCDRVEGGCDYVQGVRE